MRLLDGNIYERFNNSSVFNGRSHVFHLKGLQARAKESLCRRMLAVHSLSIRAAAQCGNGYLKVFHVMLYLQEGTKDVDGQLSASKERWPSDSL